MTALAGLDRRTGGFCHLGRRHLLVAVPGFEYMELPLGFHLHDLTAGLDQVDPSVCLDGRAGKGVVREGRLGALALPGGLERVDGVAPGVPPAALVEVFEIGQATLKGEVHEQLATLEVLAGTGAAVTGQAAYSE